MLCGQRLPHQAQNARRDGHSRQRSWPEWVDTSPFGMREVPTLAKTRPPLTASTNAAASSIPLLLVIVCRTAC